MENRRLAGGNQKTTEVALCRRWIWFAHRDQKRSEPYPEEWLLIEWPSGEAEPAKYWLSTLSAQTRLTAQVSLAKHRWIIERDYEELKHELG